MDWDEYFVRLAHTAAMKSKDPSTKVGSVLADQGNGLVASGYNGFPRGVEHADERYERPLKYKLVAHSELNTILQAARNGVPTKGTRLYLNWEPLPCYECTKAVINAGIVEIVGPDRPFGDNNDWRFEEAEMMLDEAGVERRIVPNYIDEATSRVGVHGEETHRWYEDD